MSPSQTIGELLENQIENFKSDLNQDVTWAFVVLVGHRPNNLTLVVVGHFLVEHLLDQIILNKCKEPSKIVNYTFSVKMQFLNSMGLLTSDCYKNIVKLNSIRNKLVHTLETGLLEKDMVFYKSNGKAVTIKKTKNVEGFYIKVLVNGILITLRNHMLATLKISPNFSKLDD